MAVNGQIPVAWHRGAKKKPKMSGKGKVPEHRDYQVGVERESEKRGASPGRWLESFADEPNKANVGPDCLRRVRLVSWVEHPAVPCERGNVGRRDGRKEPMQFGHCGGKDKWRGDA